MNIMQLTEILNYIIFDEMYFEFGYIFSILMLFFGSNILYTVYKEEDIAVDNDFGEFMLGIFLLLCAVGVSILIWPLYIIFILAWRFIVLREHINYKKEMA